MPQSTTASQASVMASLFVEAVRQGQSLWFRVASNSMIPLMRAGDNVYIQPAQASEIRPGEIAAFETSDGLVIHRIIDHQQREDSVRLLQMSDVELLPSWVKEQAVVGRVVSIRRKSRQVDLHHPIAKWCGKITARIRYRLYLHGKNGALRIVLRGYSRLAIHFGYWCIRCCCASPAKNNNLQV
jgi:signal peptidase I